MINFLKIFASISIIILCFLGMFLFKSIDTLMHFFPLENLDAVVFTLTHNVGGTYKIMWILLEPCLKASIENTFISFALISLFSICFAVFYCKKEGLFNLRTIFKNALSPMVICICFFLLFTWTPVIYKFPLMSYIKFYGSLLSNTPIHNSLYENDYVHPDSVKISFDKKKNLILIMLESMESNFQDIKNGGNLNRNLIPEITELMKNNVSFVPGGQTVEGTGWTMGETIAKTCGIPLQEPIGQNHHGIRNYLGKATCLTDILGKNGYEIKLVQGSDAVFASMNYFSTSHSIEKKNIYDLYYFKKRGLSPSDTTFFNSIKDADLYNETKEIINNLEKQDKPWMVWLYTLDTHFPYGRVDSNCIEKPPFIERKDQYPYVLQCASKLINDFIEWARSQDWFENTTIAVMGDHPAMIAPEVVGFPPKKFEHFWLVFFVNSEQDFIQEKRAFTSFDMFPTILEAMSAKIEGHTLGLGRSLFSNEKNLIEMYGRDSLNTLIKKKGTKYKSFWD